MNDSKNEDFEELLDIMVQKKPQIPQKGRLVEDYTRDTKTPSTAENFSQRNTSFDINGPVLNQNKDKNINDKAGNFLTDNEQFIHQQSEKVN